MRAVRDWRSRPTVAGLDLSLTNTGIAILNNAGVDVDGAVFTTALIRSSGSKTDDVTARASRIDSIATQVLDNLVAYAAVEFVVIESPSYGSTGGAAHERAGLWWAVVTNLCRQGIGVATVSPTGRAKYATGNGRSDKDIVLAAAIRRYDTQTTNGITNNNVADAVILAAMGARHLGCPVEDELPQQHIAALRGAAWPTAA